MLINFISGTHTVYGCHRWSAMPEKLQEHQQQNSTVPSINPVGLPLSGSGHRVKKLGIKWSKLLGTRTKLTENIRPPHTVWTAGVREHMG